MIRTTILSAVALAASACHFGADAEDRDPGSSVSRNYQLAAFDRIEVAGPYDVKVTTGGSPGASATGGDKLLDETEVVVENGTLKIRAKKHKGLRFNWGKRGKAEFAVTTAMLHGAGIAGSGGIAVDKVEGDFKGGVAGSGNLQLAAVNGGAVELEIAGSGKITAAGTAASAKVGIAGSGDVDAAGLAATTAEVSIAGSGNVRANASDTAKVDIAGSGNVTVTGGAKCDVSKAGSGNVTCG
ncbi:MAG TPA: head GIN domain-containing protein [Sphingomicrobium sp.]|nr:head GIN domain-containing protein [Sphingomicrobium sp.]